MRLRIGIVVSQFNADITSRMLAGALDILEEWNVAKKNILITRVPGSFEIPFGCLRQIKRTNPHAIIALGCVIKGETNHDHYIASAVSHGITHLSLTHHVPIAFGVITTNNLAQAAVRSRGEHNKDREAALTALQMAFLD